MSDEKVLTKEIAEQFLADDDSVDLREFTTIEDAAAESLSKYEGGPDDGDLWLNGLTELSDAAAESLRKNRGEFLFLYGLTSLSDAAAESLSKHAELGLNLDNLPESTAEILRSHPSFTENEDEHDDEEDDWDDED